MMKTDLSMPRLRQLDVAVPLVIMGLVVVGTSQIEAESTERAVDGLAYACGAMAAGALIWWRRFPVIVIGVVSVAIAVYLARQYPGGPVLLPVPLSTLALGYVAPKRVAWLGVAGLLVATTVGSVIAGQGLFFHLFLIVGWGAAGVLAGQALAARGDRAAAERERVAHAHEQALAGERLRIAQDVHDSVAHAMATINVQSGVAAHLIKKKPEQAVEALEAIRTASRDALDELGSILGVLRESGSAAPLAPLSGLEDIPSLVDRARVDGATVTLDQSGTSDSIPATVSTAAYRAVQEALTNTRRHAGPAAVVTVTVDVDKAGGLRVAVRDDGGGKALNGSADIGASLGGFGLVGMRERVEATGGALTVGPASPAGFSVEAVWPDRASR